MRGEDVTCSPAAADPEGESNRNATPPSPGDDDGFLVKKGLKFASKCRRCAKTISVGVPVWYIKTADKGFQHTCTTCHPSRLRPQSCAHNKASTTASGVGVGVGDVETVSDDGNDEFSVVYNIKCGAMLLTWNYGDPKKNPRPSLDEFKTFLEGKGADRISLCFEQGTCDHAHAFIEGKKWDCTINAFMVGGVPPNVQPNKGKGSGARTTKDRGHFYVVCKYKDSHQESWTNYEPAHAYAVKTIWVQTLYQQAKVTKAIECAAHYLCLTPPLEALVRLSDGKRKAAQKAIAREQREKRLRGELTTFEYPHQILEWKSQYEVERLRYKFLVIWGRSLTGKTEFARSLFQNAFIHSDNIAWAGYDEEKHDAVIFDDIKMIYKMVSDNRALFQASGTAMQQTSATNMYALTVDVTAKPLVVTSNYEPRGEWLWANAVVMHVSGPLYGPDGMDTVSFPSEPTPREEYDPRLQFAGMDAMAMANV